MTTTKPPVAQIYECELGPAEQPNGWVRVIILNKDRDRRFFVCKIVSIDPRSTVSPPVGATISIHSSKLTPTPDWDKWGMEEQVGQAS